MPTVSNLKSPIPCLYLIGALVPVRYWQVFGFHFYLPWVIYKVGISERPWGRWKEINASMEAEYQHSIYWLPLGVCPVLWASTLEGWIHGAFSLLRVHGVRGTGENEWFWPLNPLCAVLLAGHDYFTYQWLDWDLCVALAIVPLPLDLWLVAALPCWLQWMVVDKIV